MMKEDNKTVAMHITFIMIIFIAFASVYLINLAQLTRCDFAPPYGCEIIHGVGVVVPFYSVITVLFMSDGQ